MRRGALSPAKGALRLLDGTARHADLIREVMRGAGRQDQQAAGKGRCLSEPAVGGGAMEELPRQHAESPAGAAEHDGPDEELKARQGAFGCGPAAHQEGSRRRWVGRSKGQASGAHLREAYHERHSDAVDQRAKIPAREATSGAPMSTRTGTIMSPIGTTINVRAWAAATLARASLSA